LRRFDFQKLILATHNKGKLREIAELLAPYQIDVTSAGDLGLPVPEETGTTFAENALIKAHEAAKASGLPALSDDSGLCVDALGGAPGVYSADWAEPGRDFTKAMQRVWGELVSCGKQIDARAHFTCVLALALPDGHSEIFEGRVHGVLVWPPRGDQGFGYDSMFVPDGYDITFGEMDPAAKHAISHRARAFEKLKVFLTADGHG
jgi:XTP/dITP diphosphohydrolase